MKILLEIIRSRLFWMIDFFKGGKLKDHVNDIGFILNNYPAPDAKKLIDDRLERILKHAVSTTLFYKDYAGYKSIVDFPVINKNLVRDRFNEFMSNKYSIKILTPVETSGSTGTPFKVYHDPGKRLRHSADIIYFNKYAGLELGMRLYFFRTWNGSHKKSLVKAWIQNIIPISVFNVTRDNIPSIVKKIAKDKSNIGIMGFSSSLESVCQYLDMIKSEKLITRVISIIAIAEELNDYTKSSMREYFGAPVVSRYANSENGIIAQQSSEGGNEFYLNYASFYVEVLNFDNDSLAPEGELGRIVVTDFFNYGMPMIRYDTGDIGRINNKNFKNRVFRVLTNIEGRKIDMLINTSGQLVNPYVLNLVIERYKDIKQFQLIQTDKAKYNLVLNSGNPYLKEKELIENLKTYLGKNAICEVKYVNEIPLLSSGKRKSILNNFLKPDRNIMF